MGKLRVTLGDDHTLMRQGLRRILEERPEWEVVAEAGDGRSAVKQALELKPDVVVLDISMPMLNGIEVTRQIVRRLPKCGVLILSMHTDEAYIIQALKAGARGYLLKDSAGSELIRAVESIAAGKSFFSPSVAKVMLDDYVHGGEGAAGSDRYDSLSERERENPAAGCRRSQQQSHCGNAVGQPVHGGNTPDPYPAEARCAQHGRTGALRRSPRRHPLVLAIRPTRRGCRVPRSCSGPCTGARCFGRCLRPGVGRSRGSLTCACRRSALPATRCSETRRHRS